MALTTASTVFLENGSATSDPKFYPGGLSVFSAVMTGGTVTLEALGPDGVTWIAVTSALAAASRAPNLNLSPGQYRVSVATSTGVFARLDRVP